LRTLEVIFPNEAVPVVAILPPAEKEIFAPFVIKMPAEEVIPAKDAAPPFNTVNSTYPELELAPPVSL